MTLLTVKDVAERLRISRSLVYQLVESGKIGCHKIGTGRGTIRFREQDVEEYLLGCRVERGEEPLTKAPRARLRHIRV